MKPFTMDPAPVSRRRRPNLTPAQLVVLAFLLAIVVGTVLLSLPISHAQGRAVSVAEAFFTATSAICVTGLIVLDTGTDFSRFGQVVIMLLIKSGGLGILTLGVLLALATGRRISFRERMRLQLQANALHVGGIVRLVLGLVAFTIVLELIGAMLLFVRFSQVHGYSEGAFYALFHSISAFNNAGFALYPDSLLRYASDPLITLTIAGLFIFGGLGFVVVLELIGRLRHANVAMFSLHTRLVLVATVLLLVIATVVVTILEWSNPATLGPFSWSTKLLAGFFQAATPRTAGFNTLDYGDMNPPTLIFTMLLMFIGASPGSTGGGVKTVTFLVLVGSAWTLSRGQGQLILFGRRIDSTNIIKAAVITTMGMMLVGAAFTGLAITDPDLATLPLAFETVSAFGTVGLSMGITAELSEAGRSIIIGLMFLGRVGLLTFAIALVAKQPEKKIKHPAEDVIIG